MDQCHVLRAEDCQTAPMCGFKSEGEKGVRSPVGDLGKLLCGGYISQVCEMFLWSLSRGSTEAR